MLINPPYAESGSGVARGDTNKIGVEKTRINGWMRDMGVGSLDFGFGGSTADDVLAGMQTFRDEVLPLV